MYNLNQWRIQNLPNGGANPLLFGQLFGNYKKNERYLTLVPPPWICQSLCSLDLLGSYQPYGQFVGHLDAHVVGQYHRPLQFQQFCFTVILRLHFVCSNNACFPLHPARHTMSKKEFIPKYFAPVNGLTSNVLSV